MNLRQLLIGPKNPRDPHISLIFPRLQGFPDNINISRQSKIVIWLSYLIVWALSFAVLANHSTLATPLIDNEPAAVISCSGTSEVWMGPNDSCGLDGEKCGAVNKKQFAFKCPAGCSTASYTYAKWAVGSYESIYRPFVIGSNDSSYRADSFLCASAIHAGVVSDFAGGGGVVTFGGPSANFTSVMSNGIDSMGFDSEFPASYKFDSTVAHSYSGCFDFRWIITCLNIVLSFIYGYFVSNAAAFFFPLLCAGFWNVILASNSPIQSQAENPSAELISLGFRRFLPCLLSSFLIYHFCVKSVIGGQSSKNASQYRSLPKSGPGEEEMSIADSLADEITSYNEPENDSQNYGASRSISETNPNLSRALLWVSFFYVGILENVVFGKLPLDRLTIHDLNAQPGSWAAVLSIGGIIIAIAIGQAYIIWRAGKLPQYLALYLGMLLVLVLLSTIPNQTLRIHHYIMALLLLPGASFPTHGGLIYQGILVGLFVSGIARWDFDSIIQTVAQLRRGTPILSGTPVFDGVSFENSTTLHWNALPSGDAWEAFSLIIDDVERYRGDATSFSISDWLATLDASVRSISKLYVRLAYVRQGGGRGDYTRAGIIDLISDAFQMPPEGAL